MAIRLVRKEGADPNALSDEGWSAVHLAAAIGDTELVRSLCSAECGGDAYREGRQGARPLDVAARHGRLATVRCLVELGVGVNEADGDGVRLFSPLFSAACGGHLAVVTYLVGIGARVDVTAISPSPLVIAAFEGHLAVVDFLLAKGAPVNAANNDGTPLYAHSVLPGGATALYAAARQGQLAVVKRLVAGGAAVNAVALDGTTPLSVARAGGHGAVVEFLVAEAIAVYARFLAGRHGAAVAKDVSNDKGATIDAVCRDGAVPLRRAAMPVKELPATRR